MEKDLGKLTCHSNWPGTQREGKKKNAPMVSSVPDLGLTDLAPYGEGEGENRGGNGMFELMAELVVVMVEVEAHRLGLL